MQLCPKEIPCKRQCALGVPCNERLRLAKQYVPVHRPLYPRKETAMLC